VDLSQWAGQQHSAKALRAATGAIMTQVADLVGQLRGETPPDVPYDSRNPASGPVAGSRLPEIPRCPVKKGTGCRWAMTEAT
jgi:hypothetical protein